ncbi:phosphotransferase [Metabacillus iocasae]|uniref:Ser/Thr protein kinase RdoA (MazF antagonist) n=1 Tax=Priestia iocasae TaxID=2291674 RepID=A0ABS2QRK8_9BACI|nr:phosphotransferase [Metabacillus iocasae]MBM7701386.1 Ser/Thr protein kinase RdoA (MazF antagonist) [Metabacillus iocasae]
MKMTKINNKDRKDDLFGNRLFLFCQEHQLTLKGYKKVKNHVYVLDTDQGLKVLKSYRAKEKVEQIYQFLTNLHQQHFYQAVNYELFPSGELLYKANDEDCYWTIQPYVKPNRKFTFKSKKDRNDAVLLLTQYHEQSRRMSKDNTYSFETYSLQQQWSRRLKTFESYAPRLTAYMSEQQVVNIINQGKQALRYLKQYEVEENALGQGIIHGDVASHNFIRNDAQTVMLIDFDLAAHVPIIYDYIQLAHRFLVYLNRSFVEVESHHFFNYLVQNQFFLSSLLFPSHVVREWNRLLVNGMDAEKVHKLQVFTNADMYYRQSFIASILPKLS